MKSITQFRDVAAANLLHPSVFPKARGSFRLHHLLTPNCMITVQKKFFKPSYSEWNPESKNDTRDLRRRAIVSTPSFLHEKRSNKGLTDAFISALLSDKLASDSLPLEMRDLQFRLDAPRSQGRC